MGASVEITENEFAEKGVMNGADRMIREACIRIAAQGKTLTPVEKGQLKNSIMAKSVYGGDEKFNEGGSEAAPSDQKISLQPEAKKTRRSGYAGTNSDHWYPEFGTRNQVAQPFMRPAKEIVMDGRKALDIGKKYGREEMEKEYRKRKTRKRVING